MGAAASAEAATAARLATPTQRFTGANLYQATSMPGRFTCGGVTTDAELDTALNEIRATGGTTVRSWFFQSFAQDRNFRSFDRLVAAARKHGLGVIPVIANHQPDCEPSGGRWRDINWYRSGYKVRGVNGYPRSTRFYAAKLAEHYRGNPTIRMWQLMNEAETSSDNGRSCDKRTEANGQSVSANVLRRFADDMTAVVNKADPTHKVSLGIMGSGQCGAANDEYRYVQAGRVQICDYHDYNDEVAALPGNLQRSIERCARLRKPLVITESAVQARRPDQCALLQQKIAAAKAERVTGILTWGLSIGGPGTTDGFALNGRCHGQLGASMRAFVAG